MILFTKWTIYMRSLPEKNPVLNCELIGFQCYFLQNVLFIGRYTQSYFHTEALNIITYVTCGRNTITTVTNNISNIFIYMSQAMGKCVLRHMNNKGTKQPFHQCSLISTFLIAARVMRKPTFCICKNKDADQLRGNRETDQRLCFSPHG